jgi:hypothetical protein
MIKRAAFLFFALLLTANSVFAGGISGGGGGGGGGGAVSSVSGTTNQIDCSPTTGTVICGLAATITAPGTLDMGANPISFTSGSLLIDGGLAHTLDLRNATNAQTLRVFNTYTNATSFEDFEIYWTANTAILWTNKGSVGGTARPLAIRHGGAMTNAITIPISMTASVDFVNTNATAQVNSTGQVRIGNTTAPSVSSGTHIGLTLAGGLAPSITSTMVFYPLNITPTINFSAGTPGAGSYEAIHIAATETALPTGTNYMVRALGGAAAATPIWSVTNTGNETLAGTLTSSRTTDLGWAIVNVPNQACNTSCTSACVFGINTAAIGNLVTCTDATADSCLCAGAS